MLRIRLFRNRLAHHDSILGQDVSAAYEDMLTTTGWVDPDARGWLQDRSSVTAVIARRP